MIRLTTNSNKKGTALTGPYKVVKHYEKNLKINANFQLSDVQLFDEPC